MHKQTMYTLTRTFTVKLLITIPSAHADILCAGCPTAYFSNQYSNLCQSERVPVFYLAYSARRILHPSPVLLEYIPKLLKVLTDIDKERKRFVGIAEQVITWQNFYKADGAGGQCVLLEDEEDKSMNKIRSEKKAALHRFAYTQLIIRWCKLVSLSDSKRY